MTKWDKKRQKNLLVIKKVRNQNFFLKLSKYFILKFIQKSKKKFKFFAKLDQLGDYCSGKGKIGPKKLLLRFIYHLKLKLIQKSNIEKNFFNFLAKLWHSDKRPDIDRK